jgi:hypothetical protein
VIAECEQQRGVEKLSRYKSLLVYRKIEGWPTGARSM